MERVDWTVDEPPKCEDCVHCILNETWLGGLAVKPELALRFAQCDIPVILSDEPTILYVEGHRKNNNLPDKCGPSGKLFERDFTRQPRDFENYPPIGAWRQ